MCIGTSGQSCRKSWKPVIGNRDSMLPIPLSVHLEDKVATDSSSRD